MALPPHILPTLAPAYPAQLRLPQTGYYNALPTQQPYGPYSVDQTSAFAVQALRSGAPVATTPSHNQRPSTLPAWQPGLAHSGAVHAGTSQPSSASAAHAGPASSMGPPDRPRKRKAATLRADDWEPYKKRILDLHIEQKRPLPEVKQMIEEEYKDFKAELRQYRSRISQWGKDKNVKLQEMQAIVRKRQKRKLVETDKGQLVFKVRGSKVEQQKIERWMKRHDVADSFLHAV
ncbi:hypothetical protein N0V87_010753 [Didymella glomerata]|uniref:Clr5 domain-containing protein n=1 Tax=Didymella glomerata TaxID=749621 RepID=A0A9W9BUD6_9PLEO|nr:hypothetical protein N0V87_010753 [Didymella glomerata]